MGSQALTFCFLCLSPGPDYGSSAPVFHRKGSSRNAAWAAGDFLVHFLPQLSELSKCLLLVGAAGGGLREPPCLQEHCGTGWAWRVWFCFFFFCGNVVSFFSFLIPLVCLKVTAVSLWGGNGGNSEDNKIIISFHTSSIILNVLHLFLCNHPRNSMK